MANNEEISLNKNPTIDQQLELILQGIKRIEESTVQTALVDEQLKKNWNLLFIPLEIDFSILKQESFA